MSFFVFHVLDLKIVPIDSELNSAPGNIKIIFFKKKGVWYLEKQPNMKKGFEILKKTNFGTKRLKTDIWWDQTLYIFMTPGIVAPA